MENVKNILIVDDDDFVLNLLERSLKEHPEYKTTTAINGEDALKKTQNEKFDLIITDIIMPEKDGIQFIDELRKTDKNTPFIVISGGDGNDNADEYINFACYFAHETLTKPFSKKELLHAIELALSNGNMDVLKFL